MKEDAAASDTDEPAATLAASPIPGAAAPAPAEPARTFWERHGHTVALIALLLFGLFVRVWTTPGIEVGGDAVKAWFNAKQLTLGITGTQWAWDHHSVRFAIIVPTWLVQESVGMDPRAYFVLPFAMSLLQMGAIYRIGVSVGRPAAGFCAAVLLVLSPPMERFGSQLLGEVFSGAFSLLGVWLLVRYQDKVASRTTTLLLLAGALFLAYLTKITNVLFVPGFALAVWVLGKRWRDVALFLGVLLGLFLAETALYALLTKHSLGQLSIIGGSHLRDRRLKPTELADFFVHVLKLTTFWQATLLSLVAALGVALARWRRSGKLLAVVALLPMSFLLLQNFAVKGIDPLVPVQRFLPRYLTPALPLALLVATWTLSTLLDGERLRPVTQLLARPMVRGIGAAVLLLGLSGWVHSTRFQGFDRHPMALLSDAEKIGNEAFAKGMPLVSTLSPKTVDFFLKVMWRGLRSEKKIEKLPKIRKVGQGRQATSFAFHPKHEKGLGKRKPPEILAEWKGREVLFTDAKGPRSEYVSPAFVMKKRVWTGR